MSDDKCCRSVLAQLFDCVNSGVGLGAVQTKSACPPRKKKSTAEKPAAAVPDAESDAKGFATPAAPEVDGTRRCPPSPCPKGRPYTPPSQICPERDDTACCYIKMQDPCAPCCCESKPKLQPCPPKCYPEVPREPVCGCDLCKKRYASGKCCDRNEAFRGSATDPRYFEKA